MNALELDRDVYPVPLRVVEDVPDVDTLVAAAATRVTDAGLILAGIAIGVIACFGFGC